ncbi:MAG: 1,2-phenylacetyl-CoA epoxidase subunit B [Ignavibacteriales bacterium]|nr:1,2-phenylacetyl-CoA epoxidase subunit B [Ignavibacteriales bacterium]
METPINTEWQLWEVFAQEKTGEPHFHCGSVHAPDKEIALQNARDVYARRGSVLNLWVVPAKEITATSPSESGEFFEPANDKIYRHPQFYHIPKAVRDI